MFKSLYSRLAVVLLGVFLVMGILLFWLFEHASMSTQNETSQRLHLELAEHIVKDLGITSKGHFDTEMIKDAFHQMMILGPTIELYVLDKEGKLITYDAPEEKIKLRQVDLKPIIAFVERKRDLPILGDDPRSTSKQKIFSAARVFAKNQNETIVGYLYIIIGGENYDSVATALRLSRAWKISLIGIASALLFLLLASLLLFYALTRPLRRLTKEITTFEQSDFKELPHDLDGDSSLNRGELNQLKVSFHQMEKRIAMQLERLNNQDKIRREFLAYVSHDLRTPLAGMKAYLETLELKPDMALSERQDFLKKAIFNGGRLEGMINELFELTRLESNQVELNKDDFAIGDLLSDIYSSLEKKAKDKKVNLTIECDEPQTQVLADIAKIERVIQNLVENAIRYSDDGETVILRAKKKDDKTIQLVIKDTGSGISAKHLPYIFEPYYRASDEYKLKHKGAGLGLAISQRLLALHGVTLNVKSTINKGTTFSFDLSSY
ncbi:MAG: HAMP domain-containing sensor histidine kinase [Cocleimonas sp.]